MTLRPGILLVAGCFAAGLAQAQSGLPGANGAPASQTVTSASPPLELLVQGGHGSEGGPGKPGNPPGKGGKGGAGGAATAIGSLSTASPAWNVQSNVEANGGHGGAGGAPGAGTPPARYGDGGDGGAASARATTRAPGETTATANASARGGNGGQSGFSDPAFPGGSGGRGGDATGRAHAVSDTGAALAQVHAYGGAGGFGSARGGDGGNVQFVNAVSGSTSGRLVLNVTGYGGEGGGANPGGIAGNGGLASARITLNDQAAREVAVSSMMNGGFGGSGFDRRDDGRGGDADNVMHVKSKGDVHLFAQTRGGYSNSGARAGAARTELKGQAAGASSVTIYGDSSSGGQAGFSAGPGTDGVAASITAHGQSDSGDVNIRIYQQGGEGGRSAGGKGGRGADSVMRNAASGATSGNLVLSQNATGGNAFDGGDGGMALSELTASNLQNRSNDYMATARGGSGGGDVSNGRDAGRGGNALARVNMSGSGDLSGRAFADGGAGGHSHSGFGAGKGGDAVAHTRVVSGGSGNVSAMAAATAGRGGGLVDVSAHGESGQGNVHVGAQANAADGVRHTLRHGPGKGGDVRLVNVVSGSTSGALSLNQSASGGSGGESGTVAARGGHGYSSLVRSDSRASYLEANSGARGGRGGEGYFGRGPGGAGGNARNHLALESTRSGTMVVGNSYAGSGYGGSSRTGAGRSGDAHATLRLDSRSGAEGVVAADANAFEQGKGGVALADGVAHAANLATMNARAYAENGKAVARGTAVTEDAGGRSQAIAFSRATDAQALARARGAAGTSPEAFAYATGAKFDAQAVATRSGAMAVSVTNRALGGIANTREALTATAESSATGYYYTPYQGVFAVSAAPADSFAAAQPLLRGAQGFMTGELAQAGDAFIASTELLFHSGPDARLSLALLGLIDGSSRLSQATFSVLVDGVEIVRETFNSFSQAAAYFSSQVLDLGTLSQGAHSFLMTTTVAGGAAFGYQFALNGVMPVPEPASWLMLLVGMALLLLAASRRQP